MQKTEEIIIEFGKVKIILLLFLSILFAVSGAFLLNKDSGASIVGLLTITFFGACGIIMLMKLFNKYPGLVLNPDGIFDNSSGISAGLIPWNEVVDVSPLKIKNQKFISIHVKNPEKYTDRGNLLRRMTFKANLKMYGTPVLISSSSLKISYEKLFQIISDYFEKTVKNRLP